MNSLSKFLAKAIFYLNRKYAIKYIDNVYWELSDDSVSGKVTTLIKKTHNEEIKKFMPGTDMDAEKKNNLKYYTHLIHIFTEYLYKISDCIIDPDYNWVILRRKHIFKYSFPMAEDPWDGMKPRPSLIKYLCRKKPLELEQAILVKYSWGNYYHFFIDTLPQIMLCDKFGLPPGVPVIVPYQFWNIGFVQEYFNNIAPLGRKIIVQEKNQYIRIKELFVAKDTFFSDSIVEMHHKFATPALKGNSITPPALLFVTRGKKYKRTIRNAAEIEAIAKEHGFTVIEAGDYNVAGQKELFSNATHIIGIHGAALMNMIFSKSQTVGVLEIFPGINMVPGHYVNLSKVLGYNYTCIIGGGLDVNSEFYVDKEIFLGKIKELVGAA